ncbi:MFS transporter [Oligoflexus tunisiensis]|uniref:MFS transporter n=1 Tax=Oligoflexus tunisiensis TaxID=708132 RepID=UPI00159F20D2|nr:MFS transporter [Oligoflexus tunisiensis]
MAKFPKNVWVLVVAAPLTMSVTSVMVLAGSFLARNIAPRPELATLPIAFIVIGMAGGVVPSIYLMKKWGRRTGHLVGISAALLGSLLAMTASLLGIFALLLFSSLCFGLSQAFVQQYRFAAIESLDDPRQTPQVLSFLMLSGIVAAFIGPEIAVRGKDWIPSAAGFAGSFLLLALFSATSFIIMLNFKNPVFKQEIIASPSRGLSEIARQPLFLLAMLAAVVGNGVMSFLMTATPLSMHDIDGIGLNHTKQVIQSHIIAMFAPSLVSGSLIKKFGIAPILVGGSLIYVATLVMAWSGHQLLHYWWALVLLGLGWNALFLGGTTLLSQCYAPHERFKVQALNDFSVFFLQALASLSAGWILFRYGWSMIVIIAAPCVLFILMFCLWYLGLHWRRRPI